MRKRDIVGTLSILNRFVSVWDSSTLHALTLVAHSYVLLLHISKNFGLALLLFNDNYE